MDMDIEKIDSADLKEFSNELILSSLEAQCSLEDVNEKASIDMYSGEKFSQEKMIIFMKKLDEHKDIRPSAIALYFDYIADHFPDQAPFCMGRIIAACRKMNKPKLGITRSYYYLKKYDVEVCSSDMFVALGAALKDIGDYETADKCVPLAIKTDYNNTNSEYIHNLSLSLEKYK